MSEKARSVCIISILCLELVATHRGLKIERTRGGWGKLEFLLQCAVCMYSNDKAGLIGK